VALQEQDLDPTCAACGHAIERHGRLGGCNATGCGCTTLIPSLAKPEAIDHPSHYGGDTVYETIKVIEAWGLDFHLGNAVKYISRAGKKDPAKLVEDLQKAAFYLARAIENAKKAP
jgi:hypothetical protein